MSEEQKWKRRIDRERSARKQAEELLEKKSLELWQANEELTALTGKLQRKVDVRSVDLAQALEKEVEANKAKSEFVSMISHEMRTPLNAIIGFSEILANPRRATDLEEEQKQHYLENIFTSSKGLLSLINDILDMAKIEAGKLELELLDFDHRKLIRQLVDTHTIAAKNKHLTLDLSFDDALPKQVCGDANRLAQIINNLMSNAIKFTDHGAVSLNIALDQVFDDGDIMILYAVTDQGIGMSEAVMERLFQPFTQADNSMSRKYGGTGLGLTISRQLCETMGGKIWVESEEGKGSTFFFKVRYKTVEKQRNASAEHVEGKVDRLKGYSLLLVEDDPINQELAKYLIESEGADLDIASNGLEGVEAVNSKPYDLVLMDLQMPVCDGYSATLKIRENINADTLPIVAMTANAASDVKARCLEVGMNDFLTKPFIIEDLLQTTEQHCKAHEIQSDRHISNDIFDKELSEESDGESLIDVNLALAALHGNRHLYGRILMQFQRCCEDGIYALDCKMIEQDLTNSLRLIYTVKRLAVSVGAFQLAELLDKLEVAANANDGEALNLLTKQYATMLLQAGKDISKIDLSDF